MNTAQDAISDRIDAEAAVARLGTLELLQVVRAELADRWMAAIRSDDVAEADRLHVAARDLDVDIQRYLGVTNPSRRRPQVQR